MPSTLIKVVSGAPISIDLSVNFLFNEKFELGASYKLNVSIDYCYVEITGGSRIGYAYDLTLSK